MTVATQPTTQWRSRVLSLAFLGFLIVVALVAVWVGTLAETAILQSRAGEVSSFSSDPTEAGFRAFTTSSETALVIHTVTRANAGAELVGASLLAGAGENSGGAIVTVPRTFVNPAASGLTMAELFEAQGLDAAVEELNRTFGIGFGDVVVLDASSWTSLMIADLPLTLTLRDDLVEPSASESDPEATEVVIAAGTRDFDLREIAVVAGHRNPGEPSLGVALRQQQIWRSWISRTAGTQDRPDLFEQESGFAELIGDLANDEVSYRTVVTTTVAAEDPAATRYEAELSDIADLIAQIVPFPEATPVVDRASVLLLDTSLGANDQLPVVTAVTRAGGLVTVLGNSDGVTTPEPEVQVHDASAVDVAREIAERLNYPAPRSVPLEDATTAITVIAR